MNGKRLLIPLFLLVLAFASCNKDHYDVSNVNSAHVEGEMLLPLVSASYSVTDMIEKFQLDDMLSFDASGNLHLDYSYEYFDAVTGSEVLKFKDNSIEEHFSFNNPFPFYLPVPLDTMVKLQKSVVLESEHIRLLSASVKSGVFGFSFGSNAAQIKRVVISSKEIRDAEGEPVEFVYEADGANSFDVSGLRFETEEYNTLNLICEIEFTLMGTPEPVITFDMSLMMTDLAVMEMSGWVDNYQTRSVIDTTYSLFSENLVGALELDDVEVSVKVRNGFGMTARMTVDTALLYGEHSEPVSVFEQMPVVVNVAPSTEFVEVLHQSLGGVLSAQGGHGFAVTNFILNPEGIQDMLTVDESNTLDVMVDAHLPFGFKVDDVRYYDTVGMDISLIESPEWIEKITMELTVNSTLPINLTGDFIMYDNVNQRVVDTLAHNLALINSTFDGQMCSTSFALELDRKKMENILRSDSMILSIGLDTDAHDMGLNVNQFLELFLKARVKYNGNVQFKD